MRGGDDGGAPSRPLAGSFAMRADVEGSNAWGGGCGGRDGAGVLVAGVGMDMEGASYLFKICLLDVATAKATK
jgi:hypothetical protein